MYEMLRYATRWLIGTIPEMVPVARDFVIVIESISFLSYDAVDSMLSGGSRLIPVSVL